MLDFLTKLSQKLEHSLLHFLHCLTFFLRTNIFFFHLALVVYHQASKWKDVKFFPLAYLLAANVTFFGLAFSKLQRD